MKLILFFVLFSSNVWSFSVSSSDVCPVKFEASVAKIEDQDPVVHAFSKVSVLFEAIDHLKGDFQESEHVQILKHGLFRLEVGKRYLVELNNGKVCLLEEIE